MSQAADIVLAQISHAAVFILAVEVDEHQVTLHCHTLQGNCNEIIILGTWKSIVGRG